MAGLAGYIQGFGTPTRRGDKEVSISDISGNPIREQTRMVDRAAQSWGLWNNR